MPSSRRHRAIAFALAFAAASSVGSSARAQRTVDGFAVRRFYASAPGAGWLVMDSLDMSGRLGGAMSISADYAMKPFRVYDGSREIPVVAAQTIADFAFAITYDRFRLHLAVPVPLVSRGIGGTVHNVQFAGPGLDLASSPDAVWEPRVGLDARVLGGERSPLRLGAGAQLIVPNGLRRDYGSDGTFRAMVRVLFAGDVGHFTYAGHVGVHVRPLDDSPVPGGPQGSELMFGVAGGAKVSLSRSTTLVLGPEIYGTTAFRSFCQSTSTALEGLLTGRMETGGGGGPHLRVKLGMGPGLNPSFGAPEWRLVFGLEVFGRVSGPADRASR